MKAVLFLWFLAIFNTILAVLFIGFESLTWNHFTCTMAGWTIGTAVLVTAVRISDNLTSCE